MIIRRKDVGSYTPKSVSDIFKLNTRGFQLAALELHFDESSKGAATIMIVLQTQRCNPQQANAVLDLFSVDCCLCRSRKCHGAQNEGGETAS